MNPRKGSLERKTRALSEARRWWLFSTQCAAGLLACLLPIATAALPGDHGVSGEVTIAGSSTSIFPLVTIQSSGLGPSRDISGSSHNSGTRRAYFRSLSPVTLTARATDTHGVRRVALSG